MRASGTPWATGVGRRPGPPGLCLALALGLVLAPAAQAFQRGDKVAIRANAVACRGGPDASARVLALAKAVQSGDDARIAEVAAEKDCLTLPEGATARVLAEERGYLTLVHVALSDGEEYWTLAGRLEALARRPECREERGEDGVLRIECETVYD